MFKKVLNTHLDKTVETSFLLKKTVFSIIILRAKT